MATNISLTTFENCAIIYFDNGSTKTVQPHSDDFFQLDDLGFCTISEAADPDSSEHPPDMVQKMYEFWKAMWEKVRTEVQDPEVTPL
jgi:hypothetical protein